MRIAYVIPTWPPSPAQPFVVNEMLAVQAAGEELVVCPLQPGVADGPAGAASHATYDGLDPVAVLPARLADATVLRAAAMTVLRRPWRTLVTLFAAHRAAGRHPWAHLRILAVTPTALAAARVLPRLRVDQIHAHFASNTAECAAIAGRISGVPYSFTAHAYDIYLRTPRYRNDTLAWKVAGAAEVVAISEHGAVVLREHLPPAARDRVRVIGVGISTTLFEAAAPTPDGPALELLSVARFVRKKGLDTLIDACALLRDAGVPFRARIFGDGPERTALADRIDRQDLTGLVTLGGPIAQEEVAARMREAQAFVLPCRADRDGDMDGIPTVFMEALASGRPVVSCAVAGIPELVRDGVTGLVVPSDDPVSLAAALRRLREETGLRQRLGAAGPALVGAEHDQETNAAQLIALWRTGL